MLRGRGSTAALGLWLLLVSSALLASDPKGSHPAPDVVVAPGNGTGCSAVDATRVGTPEPATCSLQAALDWAATHADPSPGDGRVVVQVRGAGVTVRRALVIRGAPGVTLELDGQGATIAPAVSDRPALSVRAGKWPIVIHDVAVQATGSAVTVAGDAGRVELSGIEVTGGGGVEATDVADLVLRQVEVSGAAGDGIGVAGCGRLRMVDVRVSESDGNGLHILSAGSSRTVAELDRLSAIQNGAAGVVAQVADDAHLDLRLTGSRLVANNVGISMVAESGELAFAVTDNPEIAGQRSHAVNLYSSASSDPLVAGRIAGNRVRGSRLGAGIRVSLGGAADADLQVSGNQISGIDSDAGIAVSARNGTGRLHAVIKDNRVDVGPEGLEGIVVSAGGAPDDAWRVCLDLSGNDSEGGHGKAGIRVVQRHGSGMVLAGLDAAGTAGAAVALLEARNPGASAAARADDHFSGASDGCRGH